MTDPSSEREQQKVGYLAAGNGGRSPPINGGQHSRHPSRDVNKELPLNPDEMAGLKAQKRQYTKEMLATKAPEVDPNHAYPNFARSTTLILCKLQYS